MLSNVEVVAWSDNYQLTLQLCFFKDTYRKREPVWNRPISLSYATLSLSIVVIHAGILFWLLGAKKKKL